MSAALLQFDFNFIMVYFAPLNLIIVYLWNACRVSRVQFKSSFLKLKMVSDPFVNDAGWVENLLILLCFNVVLIIE